MPGQAFVTTSGVPGLTIAPAPAPLIAARSVGLPEASISGGAGIAIGERQGPAGPPGPPGADGRYVAGAILSGEKALMFAADGTVILGDPMLPSFVYAGISLFAAQAGADITARSIGDLEAPFWAWAPGLPVFVALNGELTQQSPDRGVAQVVGWAVTPTKLHLRADAPVFVQS